MTRATLLILSFAIGIFPIAVVAQKPTRAPTETPPSPITGAHVAALAARSIGPAVMGGRVSDFALHPTDPFTFYVGLATGGVWKTEDNGDTFSPVFDSQAVASIGALAVSPSAPGIVWAGTGEANDRNSSGWGNGVYRSGDGGATWKHMGLPASKAIARIVAHPTDSNTAYVAVAGDLWSPGGERGL